MKNKKELGSNSTIELVSFLTKTKTNGNTAGPLGKLNILLDILKDSNNGILKNISNRQIYLNLTNPEITYNYDNFNRALRSMIEFKWIEIAKTNEEVKITINPIFADNKNTVEIFSMILEKGLTFAPLALFVDFIAITDENGHYQSDKLFVDIYKKAKKQENTNCFRYMRKLCECGLVTKHAKLHYSYDNEFWR